MRRDEARRPRAGFADRHPGGAGAPPGSTKRPRQELADDLIVALPAFGLLEREILALPAPGPLERENVALSASGLLERDVTETETKAIFLAGVSSEGPKRKRGPALTNRPQMSMR